MYGDESIGFVACLAYIQDTLSHPRRCHRGLQRELRGLKRAEGHDTEGRAGRAGRAGLFAP